MIVSFGLTSPAVIARRKTKTRRDWKPKHAAKFKAGVIFDAWNTSPRNITKGPHKIARCRVTRDAYQEPSNAFPDEDWEPEGFNYLDEIGAYGSAGAAKVVTEWFTKPRALWVLWFEVLEVYEEADHG